LFSRLLSLLRLSARLEVCGRCRKPIRLLVLAQILLGTSTATKGFRGGCGTQWLFDCIRTVRPTRKQRNSKQTIPNVNCARVDMGNRAHEQNLRSEKSGNNSNPLHAQNTGSWTCRSQGRSKLFIACWLETTHAGDEAAWLKVSLDAAAGMFCEQNCTYFAYLKERWSPMPQRESRHSFANRALLIPQTNYAMVTDGKEGTKNRNGHPLRCTCKIESMDH